MADNIDDSTIAGIAALNLFNKNTMSDSQLKKIEDRYFKEKDIFDSSKATHKLERNIENYSLDIESSIEEKFKTEYDVILNKIGLLESNLKNGSITKEDYQRDMDNLNTQFNNLSAQRDDELQNGNIFNNEKDKLYVKTLQDIASDVNNMTRQELKQNLIRMERLMGVITNDGGDHQDFLLNQYAKTIDFMQKEYTRRSDIMSRAFNSVSELSEQYLDLQSLYAGFVNHNPLAMFMFKIGSDFVKRWRENKQVQKELVFNDLQRQEMAEEIERDKQKDIKKQEERAERLFELDVDQTENKSKNDKIVHDQETESVNDRNDMFGQFSLPVDEFSNTGDAALDNDMLAQIMGVTGGESTSIFSQIPVDQDVERDDVMFERVDDLQSQSDSIEEQFEDNQRDELLLDNVVSIVEILEKQNSLLDDISKKEFSGGGEDNIIDEVAGGVLGGVAGKALSKGKGLIKGLGKGALTAGLAAGGALTSLPSVAGKAITSASDKIGDLSTKAGKTFSRVGSAASGIKDSVIGSVAKSGGAKAIFGSFGKSLAKKIPGISILAGLGFGVSRLLDGDFSGAGLEVLSGVAGTVPGIGTAASLAIDGGLAAKDVGFFDSKHVNDSQFNRNSSKSFGLPQPQNLSSNNSIGNLLDTISQGEGTDDIRAQKQGFKSGYDVTLGYGKYDPENFDKPITQMTLGEVKEFQRGMLANQTGSGKSSAVGRYQIISGTLAHLQDQLKLSDDTLFNKETQDKMAVQLLKNRGFERFKDGKMTPEQFQTALAKEWASIATSETGLSYYGQATGTSSDEIQTALSPFVDDSSNAIDDNVVALNQVQSLPDRRTVDNISKLEGAIDVEQNADSNVSTITQPITQRVSQETERGKSDNSPQSARNQDSSLQRITDRFISHGLV